MRNYDNWNEADSFPSHQRKTGKQIPTYYEDISSDYTPEEKESMRRRQQRGVSAQQQAQPERKYYDDSLLKRKHDPQEQQRKQAELRQRALEERRRAREAQEAVRRQRMEQNTGGYAQHTGDAAWEPYGAYDPAGSARGGYYDAFNRDPADDSGYRVEADLDPYDRSATPGRQSRRRKRDLDDTMENIPLAGYGAPTQPRGRAAGYDQARYDHMRSGGRPDRLAKQKKKKKRRVLKGVLIVLLALIVTGTGVIVHMLGGLQRTELSDIDKLAISDAIDQKYGNQDIINIALFGIDTRDEASMSGLSDSIMILSVNRKTGALKLISILRDSLVSIEGHGKEKVTHAYSYGGAELAIKVLNQNFHMNIQDYATVNFAMMADIIDTLGGIDLEITAFEWEYTNGIGQSTYGRKNYTDLEGPGLVHMNGQQAVSFARIRTDSDNNRAERQRKVLSLLLDKVKSMSVLKYPSLIRQLLGYVETSLSYDEIMGFIPLVTKNITLAQTAVPDETLDDAKGGMYNGNWVWRYDLDAAAERIHSFIYESDGATQA